MAAPEEKPEDPESYYGSSWRDHERPPPGLLILLTSGLEQNGGPTLGCRPTSPVQLQTQCSGALKYKLRVNSSESSETISVAKDSNIYADKDLLKLKLKKLLIRYPIFIQQS